MKKGLYYGFEKAKNKPRKRPRKGREKAKKQTAKKAAKGREKGRETAPNQVLRKIFSPKITLKNGQNQKKSKKIKKIAQADLQTEKEVI